MLQVVCDHRQNTKISRYDFFLRENHFAERLKILTRPANVR